MASMQDAGFFCIPDDKLSEDNRHIYGGICIASALLGLLGAGWQVHCWKPLLRGCSTRRKPSPSPIIVFCLALANLMACIGVVLRGLSLLISSPPKPDINNETILIPLGGNTALVALGTVIEAWVQYWYCATFLWTVIYAWDIQLQLRYKDSHYILYHVICWLIPALMTLGSVIVSYTVHTLPHSCPDDTSLILRHLFVFIPILFAILAIPVLFYMSSKQMELRLRECGLVSTHNRSVMSALKRKFLAIVLIFILCWIPNVLDSIIEMILVGANAPTSAAAQFFPLWVIEAALNPLQGILNCFAYGRHVLFHRIMRRKEPMNITDDRLQESTPILYRSGYYS